VAVTTIDPHKFAERLPAWLQPQGPESDVVISSRVRLARNLAGFPFVSKLSDERAIELAHSLRDTLLDAGAAAVSESGAAPVEMVWIEMAEVSPLVRLLLRERHLVSRDLAPVPEERPAQPGRAVAFARDESFAVMVNEEDHLRLQALAPGFQLAKAWEGAQALERALDGRIEPAFDRDVGYLTCCPTNVGTGLRASVMLHLPALGMVRSEIEKVFAAASRTGLAVRGLYGEGSRAFGDYYQVSNQVTLGRSEEDLLTELGELVPAIVRFERTLRENLLLERRAALVDKISRSFGLLRTARAMPTDGALSHLSSLRLGLHLGLWSELAAPDLARARVQIQKGHVQALNQDPPQGEVMETSERDRLRAAYLRKLLATR